MNNNNLAISYLRAFITMLVVAHHAFLAYAGFVPAPATSFLHDANTWTAFPIVDKERWMGFDLIILFNDTFFMSLMFFLSGLFVWKSIARKGSGKYLQDRLVRLGLPFILVSGFLIPLAYYPSYLLTDSGSTGTSFFREWLSLSFWPSGPCWFIGALLLFDVLAVVVFRFAPNGIEAMGRCCLAARRRPGTFFLVLLGVSIVALLPMLAVFGPFRWLTFGPFAIQASRILFYLAWFFTGTVVGAGGIDKGLLAVDGKLTRYWGRWVGIASIAFIARVFLMILIKKAGAATPAYLLWLSSCALALSCCAISFALLAVFLRFANRNVRFWDSCSANAYGIYLIHYTLVIWIQYCFLNLNFSPVGKGMAVFVLTLLLSWTVIGRIRRILSVDRILSNGRFSRN